MISFSAFWLLLIGIVALIPILMMRGKQTTTWWDYLSPFLGVVLWFIVAVAGVGSTATLSNFVVEEFCVAIVSILMPWARWGLTVQKTKSAQKWSLALTFLPLATAVIIRLTMPSLPE